MGTLLAREAGTLGQYGNRRDLREGDGELRFWNARRVHGAGAEIALAAKNHFVFDCKVNDNRIL